ncbi:MAG: 30S ribosomal protein S20 [Mycoplasmataceae bacterium CE_OT135]|nr:MAG: 30S ribosomal protein S20 [Mycoplasmataceae bacterium CE_OT135]
MALSLNKKKALKDKKRQTEKRKYRTLIKNQKKIIEKECSKQSSLKKNEVNFANLKKLLSQGQKILDKAAQKGIIHKNNAARKKSKISQKINDLTKQIKLDNSVPVEE